MSSSVIVHELYSWYDVGVQMFLSRTSTVERHLCDAQLGRKTLGARGTVYLLVLSY